MTDEQKQFIRDEVKKSGYFEWANSNDYWKLAEKLNELGTLPGDLTVDLDVVQNYLFHQLTPEGLPLAMMIEEYARMPITEQNAQIRSACWLIDKVVWHSNLKNLNIRGQGVQLALGALVLAKLATQAQMDGLNAFGKPDYITAEDILEAIS